MYALLSPAKKMSFDRHRDGVQETSPILVEKTAEIVKVLKGKTADDLSELMHLSEKLAQLNYKRYQSFGQTEQGRAVEAFQGDTYVGFSQADLSEADLTYAQNHVGILSGLYGLLRPLDVIAPYRLEMGTKLSVQGSKNLYEFWGDTITKTVNKQAGNAQAIINLASKEYISVIDPAKLKVPFTTCDFKEVKEGKPKTIGLFAKRARGMMARYIVKNRIENIDGLKAFNLADYTFDAALSNDKIVTFIR